MAKIALLPLVLFVAGLVILLTALPLTFAHSVGATPKLLITEVPPSEPPTRTSEPPNVGIPPNVGVPPNVSTAPPEDDMARGVSEEEPTSTPTPMPIPTVTNTPIIEIADPAITKSVRVSAAQVGEVVEFTLTVTNRGNGTATGVVVEDSMPDFLALEAIHASRGTVNVNGSSLRVEIGDVPSGDVVTITVTTRAVAAIEPPNNSNVATLSTTSSSDDPNNNRGVATLVVSQPPPPRLPRTSDSNDVLLPLLFIVGITLIIASLITRRREV